MKPAFTVEQRNSERCGGLPWKCAKVETLEENIDHVFAAVLWSCIATRNDNSGKDWTHDSISWHLHYALELGCDDMRQIILIQNQR